MQCSLLKYLWWAKEKDREKETNIYRKFCSSHCARKVPQSRVQVG